MNQQTPIWERQTDESSKHYAWFYEFLMLDSERSMLGAYRNTLKARGSARNPATVPSSWREVARQRQWKERAAAYDEEQLRVADIEYSERRLKLRGRAMDAAEEMLERAMEMLQFPLMEVVSVDGKTIIKPARWTFDTVPKLMAMIERFLRSDELFVTVKVPEQTQMFHGVDVDSIDDARLLQIAAILEEAQKRAAAILEDEKSGPLRLVG